MGLKESYLSQRISGKKQYNADMVTVVSEKAVNAQMRSYLASCSWKTSVYFLRAIDIEHDGDVVLFMLDQNTDESKIPDIFELKTKAEALKKKSSSIYKELEKLNLFSQQAGTKSTDNEEVKAAAFDYSLGFAIRLEDGIPEEIIAYLAKNKGTVDPDQFLKIMTVNPENNSVLFRQFFKKFEVIQINTVFKGHEVFAILSVNKQKLSSVNPLQGLWTTTCSINVDLRETSHNDIMDAAVRKKIENMSSVPNPDTVFDISQLLLDLSTMQTVSPVSIEGIDSDVKKKISGLVEEYFGRLEKAGQTVFGYIVMPTPNNQIKYLFTPNARNFAVSEKAFYYLINFEDGKKPTIPDMGNHKDFEWKPLLDNSTQAHGAMIINATKFLPVIRSKFEPALQKLAMNLHPYIKAGVYEYDVKWEGGMDLAPQRLCVNVDRPWEAEWSYQHQFTQDYQCLWAPPLPHPLASGKIDSNYQASCMSQIGSMVENGITYPSYDFVINVKGWLNYGYNSDGNSGWYYDHTLLFQVGIKIDADGNFTLKQKVTDTDNKPGGVKIGDWGKFCSFGTLDGATKRLTNKLSSMIDELSKTSVKSFLEEFNSFTGWFMPGCRTFTYKNEDISTYGDLYSYVNYVQEQ